LGGTASQRRRRGSPDKGDEARKRLSEGEREEEGERERERERGRERERERERSKRLRSHVRETRINFKDKNPFCTTPHL
jgi:hypothetical protein